MSNCELIRGLPTLRFGNLDSLEQLNPARDLLQSVNMRDNWEATEPLMLTLDQQRQHQHQTDIQEQNHHPPQSATTPSWGITDRIVKQELPDDKNEDSGVSPGHYTSNSASPRSRRSSVVNCSLSPGSATSDSQSMQCTAFEYSPNLYKPVNSPLNYGRMHSPDELTSKGKGEHHSVDIVSNSMKPHEETHHINDNLQCPYCIFTASNRVMFSEHLSSHYSANCETPEFGKSVMDQLTPKDSLSGMDDSRASPVISGDRSEHESEETEEVGVPRINSQGKVKTFRCRQCNYVAITKLEFWQHNRSHIKADKLLTCPRCPFVTEYKHHLEYHLRNHFGSKPFKCDKCSYSCVNKSMLNSHLKSHSNVYQYRCANCSYATKYCHSLKLHLRKYSHEPAMVLNADGSPNPLPIIDVYGTRRGPKQKPMKMQEEGQYDMQGQLNNNMINMLQSSIISSQMMVPGPVPPMGGHINMGVMNRPNGMNDVNGINGLVPNPANMVAAALSYNPFFAGIPLANSLFSGDSTEKAMKLKAFLDYAKTMNGGIIPEELLKNNFPMGNFLQHDIRNPLTNGIRVPKINEHLTSPAVDHNEDRKVAPLDLSKQDSNLQKERVVVNCPKLAGTSRRKGKAVKLDKQIMEEESDDEQNQEEILNTPAPGVSFESLVENKNSISNDSIGKSSEFTCQYCEISFGNDVMYTVHMGYHGYQNPFTCNMCGHQCSDKVSFFLHIAKSKH